MLTAANACAGVIDTSWAIVFIPFFLSLCLFACAPAAGWCFKDEKPFFAFVCALVRCAFPARSVNCSSRELGRPSWEYS